MSGGARLDSYGLTDLEDECLWGTMNDCTDSAEIVILVAGGRV